MRDDDDLIRCVCVCLCVFSGEGVMVGQSLSEVVCVLFCFALHRLESRPLMAHIAKTTNSLGVHSLTWGMLSEGGTSSCVTIP